MGMGHKVFFFAISSIFKELLINCLFTTPMILFSCLVRVRSRQFSWRALMKFLSKRGKEEKEKLMHSRSRPITLIFYHDLFHICATTSELKQPSKTTAARNFFLIMIFPTILATTALLKPC